MTETGSSRTTSSTLVFYTRAGCHLCEVAKLELEQLRERISFRIEVRDVDADEDWAKKFGDEVPVGVLGGRKVFKYRLNADRLEVAIKALNSQRAHRSR
jgi:hypothetical protein